MTDTSLFVAGSEEEAEEFIKGLKQGVLQDIIKKKEEILTLVDSITLCGSSFESAALSQKIVGLTEELKQAYKAFEPSISRKNVEPTEEQIIETFKKTI